MMLRPRCFGRTVLFLMIVAAPSASAQITSNPALPVTRGRGIVRVQAKLFQASAVNEVSDRSLTVFSIPLVAVYGVSPKLAVFGVVPVVRKRLETTELDLLAQGDTFVRGPTGLGDVRVFARYIAFQSNHQGRTMRVAPFAGVELPTGRNDAADDRGRLPASLQLGSGSWDPFAGFAFTWQTLGWQINVAPAYQRNTAADGFRFGDQARVDAGFKVRVLPRTLGAGIPRFLYANLETNLIHNAASESDDEVIAGTGDTTWYLGPGMQFITQRYIVEGAIQIPILQDLGEDALRRDYIATLSVRLNL